MVVPVTGGARQPILFLDVDGVLIPYGAGPAPDSAMVLRQGLAAVTLDFQPWAAYLLDQLRRSIDATGDERLLAIQAEVSTYPNIAALADRTPAEPDEPPLLVPWTLERDGQVLSLFTTLTTFGTPRDITLEELVRQPGFVM
jgi:hypothetical protein